MKAILEALDAGKLVCIVGPTASGKTELAVKVCEEVGGEIVSADSVQVYRRFAIGTGKPSTDERERVPHHLVDVVDPLDAMDAARWVALADEAIAAIRARNKIPIVCGGTFLWVKGLISGLASAPPADEKLRAEHRKLALEHGREALHVELGKVDPKSAARLHPNDVVRVSRALEVFELTGEPLSEIQAKHAFATHRYDAALFALEMTREEVNARVEKRIASWLADGWVDQVRALLADGLGSARAMGSVGFRQIVEALGTGTIDEAALAETIARATRVFVRRQLTWLNHEPVKTV